MAHRHSTGPCGRTTCACAICSCRAAQTSTRAIRLDAMQCSGQHRAGMSPCASGCWRVAWTLRSSTTTDTAHSTRLPSTGTHACVVGFGKWCVTLWRMMGRWNEEGGEERGEGLSQGRGERWVYALGTRQMPLKDSCDCCLSASTRNATGWLVSSAPWAGRGRQHANGDGACGRPHGRV